MKWWWLVGLVACGGSGPAEEGERCSGSGTTCNFGGDAVLLCVDGRWSTQETCPFGEEECVSSKGNSVCSAGGEPCSDAGATRCDHAFSLLQCDGQGWHLYEECFPATCELTAGEARCEG